MKIVGSVTNKNEQAVGHSQVRLSSTIDLGDGVKRPVEVILSTPDVAVLNAFGMSQEVTLETPVA